MSIYQQEAVTLKELQAHMEAVDLEDGEMVTGVKCRTNGTFPRDGHEMDSNDDPYRWHNFLLVKGEVYDELAEEYGEETEIPWDVLYDAGVTSSQFERDLDKDVPRGVMATLTVQRVGDELNVLTHELHISTAENKARFNDQKDIDEGTAINQGQTNGETVTA